MGGEEATLPPVDVAVTWDEAGGGFEAEYPLGPEARLWDEFDPALYRLTATLEGGDESAVTFGLREIATAGTQFVLNGRKTYFRGTTECAIFPRTGHPPMDVEWWRRTIRVARSHGLNHFRYHSFCPPEAAFEAADELGFYFQVEVASWANSSTRLGMGLPVDDWIERESERIVREYGNHPSFVLMAYGNEPGGRYETLARTLGRALEGAGPATPLHERLGLAGAAGERVPRLAGPAHPGVGGGTELPGERQAPRDADRLPGVRRRARGAGRQPRDRPVVRVPPLRRDAEVHRVPEAPELRDLPGDPRGATGCSTRPRISCAPRAGSRRSCYKEEVESALRTPGMGGFQLLQLHDFPGQGTALVGVLDPFWEEKGYVTPDEFRRFCNRTVPLARLDKRVFTTAETLEADIEVVALRGRAARRCRGRSGASSGATGRPWPRASWGPASFPWTTGPHWVASARPLADLAAPARYRLVVGLDGHPLRERLGRLGLPNGPGSRSADGSDSRRDSRRGHRRPPAKRWACSSRGPPGAGPGGRVSTDRPGLLEHLLEHRLDQRAGAAHPGHPVRPGAPGLRRPSRRTSTATGSGGTWSAGPRRWSSTTCRKALRPTVQVIDDWFTNRRLGLVLEAKVGEGRLLVTSIDLTTGLEDNVVARQLRRSLLDYMASDRFAPTVELTPAQVRSLVES